MRIDYCTKIHNFRIRYVLELHILNKEASQPKNAQILLETQFHVDPREFVYLCGLPEATGEAVVDERVLEDLLDGGVDVHGAGRSRGGCGHGNITPISFDVRHGGRVRQVLDGRARQEKIGCKQ